MGILEGVLTMKKSFTTNMTWKDQLRDNIWQRLTSLSHGSYQAIVVAVGAMVALNGSRRRARRRLEA